MFFSIAYFVFPLNRFPVVRFSSIHFIVTRSLFYMHLFWQSKNVTDFYYVLFVYLNIRLTIRWIFSDYHLCYLKLLLLLLKSVSLKKFMCYGNSRSNMGKNLYVRSNGLRLCSKIRNPIQTCSCRNCCLLVTDSHSMSYSMRSGKIAMLRLVNRLITYNSA